MYSRGVPSATGRVLALSTLALLTARGGSAAADTTSPAVSLEPAPPPAATLESAPEAPPALPRHKGVVVESRLGVLGFIGQFRHVAPTASWLYTQVGYEPLNWLMFLAYGELAMTDTSEAQDPSHARAFPMFGFGGGVRFTWRPQDRIGAFVQANLGGMKADVPTHSFANIGYPNAESLGVDFGARLGVEWYQIDRHMALGAGVGIRDAKGFSRTAGPSDTPLMLDASLALRYTF